MEFSPRKGKTNKYCSVHGCKSHGRKHDTVRFHKFPSKKDCKVKILNHFNQEESIDHQDAWVKVLRIEKKISPYMLVCSLHFTQDDYIPSLSNKRHHLKKTAVPSVNLPKSSVQCFNKSDNISSVLRDERQQGRSSVKDNITNDAQQKTIEESINLIHHENFEDDNDLNDQSVQENIEKTTGNEEDEQNLDDYQLSAIKQIVQNFECCIHPIINEAARNLKKIGINISDEIMIPRLSSMILIDNHENQSCDEVHNDHPYSSSRKGITIEEKSALIKVFNKFESCAKLNVQVALKQVNDVGTQVNTEFIIPNFSNFISSDGELSTLTGIPNFELLKNITEMVDKVKPSHSSTRLDSQHMIIMTFMKLKQNMSYAALAILFKSYCANTCRDRIFKMIDILYDCLKPAIFWPSKNNISKNIPLDFVGFENVRAVIDCTEISIQRPKNLCCQIVSYSRYKSNYTVKFMTAVTPGGIISFISKPYGGRSSDNAIFEQSGIINILDRKDDVMADRGFTVDGFCQKNDVKLITPPFLKNREQFPKVEAMRGRKIAQARVHIERFNQRIKTFEILSSKMPIDLVCKVEKIFTIVCAIINLSKPILNDDKFIKV